MAWPRCPECRTPDLHVYDTAECLTEEPVKVPLRVGVVVVPAEDCIRRSYACRACGWTGISVERIETHRPSSLVLRRKYPAQPVEHESLRPSP
jgi:hypothetical protein